MRRLLNLCAAHPWWVLGGLLLLSLLAATQIPRVEVQISAESLLVLDDPQRDYFDSVSRRFGDEKMVLLVLEGEALLAPARLDALRAVLGELQGLPFVGRVESLFSVPHLKSVDGYLDKAPYLERPPASPGEAAALLESARKDPFVRHLLLSEDGRVMAAALILKPGRQGGDDPTVTAAIDRLIR